MKDFIGIGITVVIGLLCLNGCAKKVINPNYQSQIDKIKLDIKVLDDKTKNSRKIDEAIANRLKELDERTTQTDSIHEIRLEELEKYKHAPAKRK